MLLDWWSLGKQGFVPQPC